MIKACCIGLVVASGAVTALATESPSLPRGADNVPCGRSVLKRVHTITLQFSSQAESAAAARAKYDEVRNRIEQAARQSGVREFTLDQDTISITPNNSGHFDEARYNLSGNLRMSTMEDEDKVFDVIRMLEGMKLRVSYGGQSRGVTVPCPGDRNPGGGPLPMPR